MQGRMPREPERGFDERFSLFTALLNFVSRKLAPQCKGKGAYSSLWIGNLSQSYGASPAIWITHCYLPPDTALPPAMQAGTRFTYPGGMEGWVDLGVGYIPILLTCPQTVTHPGTNHLIATGPGVKTTTSRSQVHRRNRYTTKPPTSSRNVAVARRHQSPQRALQPDWPDYSRPTRRLRQRRHEPLDKHNRR